MSSTALLALPFQASVPTPAVRPAALPARAGHYQPACIRSLFDELAATYDCAAWLSGGLLGWWRARLAAALPRPPGSLPAVIVDLMAGGADLWPALRRRFGPGLRVAAIDFSAPMLARAAHHASNPALTLHCADALATPLPDAWATALTCAFGLKTLPTAAYPTLAAEAARLLQPGGTLALTELVLLPSGWQRGLLLHYLAAMPRLLGRLWPAATAHAALLRYARSGPDLPALTMALRAAGFEQIQQQRLWPGCAVLISARKPSEPL
ncbi:methyltransferase domain-containing protein [Hymenobacter lapidiphilus]|uniref:Class I SAM-dependent methyltransferase n=1 Tax=Hymenobacter lapidiphilus TaxID=2608003 RepID=A0A7Y7PMY6_9BACT|nr:methyltransferase domain-containing protein [Hymenobacter lapidiphilus]NVO30737.1 class I SAM-dependent methyltransferase [Hymenobacter lapidiphilus]